MTDWNAHKIGRALARQVFQRKHLVIVPNCNWPGNETDLLVVTPDLRIIDVEIKISRADLKADAHKDKWYHHWDWKLDGPWDRARRSDRRPRQWPLRVWKHYYAMPEKVWNDEMTPYVQPASGVIAMTDSAGRLFAHVVRRSKPCRDAEKISAVDAIDIARLASLRMWDALDELAKLRQQVYGGPA